MLPTVWSWLIDPCTRLGTDTVNLLLLLLSLLSSVVVVAAVVVVGW